MKETSIAGDIVACVTLGRCRPERQTTMSICLSTRPHSVCPAIPFTRCALLCLRGKFETYVPKVSLFTATVAEETLSNDAGKLVRFSNGPFRWCFFQRRRQLCRINRRALLQVSLTFVGNVPVRQAIITAIISLVSSRAFSLPLRLGKISRAGRCPRDLKVTSTGNPIRRPGSSRIQFGMHNSREGGERYIHHQEKEVPAGFRTRKEFLDAGREEDGGDASNPFSS